MSEGQRLQVSSPLFDTTLRNPRPKLGRHEPTDEQYNCLRPQLFGKTGEYTQAEPLLQRIVTASEPARLDSTIPDPETNDTEQPPVFRTVLANKRYGSNDLLKYTASLKAEAVVPAKKPQSPAAAQSRAR